MDKIWIYNSMISEIDAEIIQKELEFILSGVIKFKVIFKKDRGNTYSFYAIPQSEDNVFYNSTSQSRSKVYEYMITRLVSNILKED